MKKLLVFIAITLISGYLVAQNISKLSPYTRLCLLDSLKSTFLKTSSVDGVAPQEETVDAFLKLNDGYDTSEIESVGVTVVNTFGQLLTVIMPLGIVEKVSELESVKSISFSEPLRESNDSARVAGNVDILHKGGRSLGRQYTGEGVIVGIVDQGIDFNHISFMDASGKSRVKMVYFPSKNITYSDPDEISRLTIDYTGSTHGTHTTGTAAGSCTKNGYQGMAPGADLVLCGCGSSFSTTNVINSCKKIFDYADQVGKPAVINMSIGANNGPHDNTDELCEAFDAMKSAGHILSISAANEGGEKMYIRHKTSNADGEEQLMTILTSSKTYYADSRIDIWSKSPHPFKVKLVVVNTLTDEILATTPLPTDDNPVTYKSSVVFATYYEGYVSIVSGLNISNNRYYNTVKLKLSPLVDNPDYTLVLKIYSLKDEIIEVWDCRGTISFTGDKDKGYIEGSDSCSINSLLYNDNTIGVGAYVTRHMYNIIVTNKTEKYTSAGEKGDIAKFSSYGIKDDGTVMPDIVAPGSLLISSFSNVSRHTKDSLSITDSLKTDDGKVYYWGKKQGTSMATPVVTGIIALWLQCKPTLTIEEIRDIFDATAVSDDYVKKYNNVKSGRGKIDAYGGIKYLLLTNIGNPHCLQDQVLIYPSSDGGKINIYAQGETGPLRINVYTSDGVNVYSNKVSTTDGSATISLGNKFASGLYIVKVEGRKARGSNTLTIK